MSRNNHRQFALIAAAASAVCLFVSTTASAQRLPAEIHSSLYSMEVIDEYDVPLDAYRNRGRLYVLGSPGQRYAVRITNHSDHRIEALLSVDGLDVIDGQPADLRKRGYIVAPYDTVEIEGFRVSTEQVASFRFSSVRNSYAGRKGIARNIGVIGLAIFAERHRVARPRPAPIPMPHTSRRGPGASPYDRRASEGNRQDRQPRPGDDAAPRSAPEADGEWYEASPPPPPASKPSQGQEALGDTSTSPSRRYRRGERANQAPGRSAGRAGGSASQAKRSRDSACCRPHKPQRPGLGTAFGERRHSAITWTQFVRATPRRPTATLELRYNDYHGLRAMGIAIWDDQETYLRETATPFPGDHRFAQPPR